MNFYTYDKVSIELISEFVNIRMGVSLNSANISIYSPKWTYFG